MITLAFAGVLVASMALALTDWRRAWYAVLVCGVLQDPVRKITPGTPAALSMSVVAVYAAILFAALASLQSGQKEFEQRFGGIHSRFVLVLLFLVLAAINGVGTFGLEAWQGPALSFLIYLIPFTALLLGYAWLIREEQLTSFFRFYAVFTSIVLIGTPMEFLRIQSPLLGVVAMPGSYIRHLPGMMIRVLSGFYRAPDIMGWHAAMLACIGITMALRAGALQKAWPWIAVTGWGVTNCILSGRRKAVYMVVVFSLVFLWRFRKSLKPVQVVSILMIGAAIGLVVREIGSSEESEVYARGTATSRVEVLHRLEGGFSGTLSQTGFLGAGLGAATQGVRHVTGRSADYGWQEGGLGKLTVELGLPGVAAIALLAWAMIRMLVRISSVADLPGTSKVIRTSLFAIFAANVANFLASAQAYSDPLLTLTTAFLIGCLFATSRLDETAAEPVPPPSVRLAPAPSLSR